MSRSPGAPQPAHAGHSPERYLLAGAARSTARRAPDRVLRIGVAVARGDRAEAALDVEREQSLLVERAQSLDVRALGAKLRLDALAHRVVEDRARGAGDVERVLVVRRRVTVHRVTAV